MLVPLHREPLAADQPDWAVDRLKSRASDIAWQAQIAGGRASGISAQAAVAVWRARLGYLRREYENFNIRDHLRSLLAG